MEHDEKPPVGGFLLQAVFVITAEFSREMADMDDGVADETVDHKAKADSNQDIGRCGGNAGEEKQNNHDCVKDDCTDFAKP